MNRCVFFLTLVSMLLVLGCVETETKRTTRKVDVSNAEIYETDMSRPRIRVALSAPPQLMPSLANRLFFEIDDGTLHYRLPGGVVAPDSLGVEGMMYSPWLNTPDSGEVVFSFSLTNEDGTNIVSDRMAMDLKDGRAWQVEVGFYDRDRCSDSDNWPLCRSYTLPRSLTLSEEIALYVVWHSEAVDSSEVPESES